MVYKHEKMLNIMFRELLIQLKTTSYHYIPIRKAKLWNIDDTNADKDIE